MIIEAPFSDVPTAAGFGIRRAEERRDWRALRMLLPQAVHHGCGCDVIVATDDSDRRRIVGAIAIEPIMRQEPYVGPRVVLHVIPPWRRRGVGRALVHAAAAVSAARNAAALYAGSKAPPDSDEAETWRRLGFDQAIDSSLIRVEAARVVEALTPIIYKLQQRGSIPAEARIVSLRDVNLDEVVELVTTRLAGLGTEPALKRRLLGKHPKPLEPRLSKALLNEGRVMGVMLGSPLGPRVGLVEANVLHPMLRGGWANAWLKLEATRDAMAAGFEKFLYEAHPQHGDTLAVTKRFGGEITPRIEPYRLITTGLR